MTKKLKTIFIFLFFIICHTSFSQITIEGTLEYDGKTRTYRLYVPASYSVENPVPLILGLHGTSSSGAKFQQYRGFDNIADTANFIAVYPDGTKMLGISFWNYGNVLGSTVDDIGFLEALVDKISQDYSINQNRVYCAGMSNGSFMAYYLACNSLKFAAIAGVTGSMSTNTYNNCASANAIPVLQIHGTADNTNPYVGNSTMKGIDEVVQFWVEKNQCNTTPEIMVVPNTNTADGATASRYLYENGINGNTVELFKINGGGHSWPGKPMPNSSEPICMDFDATQEIWRFFNRFERTLSLPNEETKAEVWPNPAQNEVFFKFKNHTIIEAEIIDLNGKRMLFKKADFLDSLNVTSLDNGMYILRLKTKKEIGFKKLIIRK